MDGLLLAEPHVYTDVRGSFMESFRADLWEQELGLLCFIQENESYSLRGVLRGLHFQEAPYAQSKLVRVVKGCIRDVVVDLRPDSPGYGRYHAEILSEENKLQLFVPKGFAHGFVALSDEAVVQYKVDAPYKPEAERCLRFDDADLQIDWGLDASECILSDKDRKGLSLREIMGR
jgi:dTDP-4-dehydrorhamnose 3,5-epimerase